MGSRETDKLQTGGDKDWMEGIVTTNGGRSRDLARSDIVMAAMINDKAE